MNFNTFVNWALAKKRIDNDGFPKNQPYQCFDLIGSYLMNCFGYKGSQYSILPVSSAYQLYTAFPKTITGKFQKIPVTQPARAGDIVVWGAGLPGSEGNGHVAIMLRPGANFISLDQNWGGAYVHQVSHNLSYVLGYLRPLPFPAAKKAAPTPVKTPTPPAGQGSVYTVRRGDTLGAIANRLKVNLWRLVGLNHIKNPNVIYAGQKLKVK